MPYYTVLDNTSGRVVVVGGPGGEPLEGYHVDGRHGYSKQDLGAQSDKDSVDRSGRRRLEAIGLERGGGR